MPSLDENIETVTRFAKEVFNEKNLQYAEDWLADDFVEHQVYPGTTPDKKGAIDSYRIFFDAVPDIKARDPRLDRGWRPGCVKGDLQRD